MQPDTVPYIQATKASDSSQPIPAVSMDKTLKILLISAFVTDCLFAPIGIILGITAYKRAKRLGVPTKTAKIAIWLGTIILVGIGLYFAVLMLAYAGSDLQF